jgi:hypothetical protein
VPYNLTLATVDAKAGWKVKIFDNEGAEEPHASVIRKGCVEMRVSLRTWLPMVPPGGKLSDLPPGITKRILVAATQLEMQTYWNSRNPHNPV